MHLAIAIALVAGMWIGKSFLNTRHSWDARTKLDTILDKIKKSGYTSLSSAERDRLFSVSSRIK